MDETIPRPIWPSTVYQLLQVEISLSKISAKPLFLELFKLQSEFILRSSNVPDKLLYAVRDTANFESDVYV